MAKRLTHRADGVYYINTRMLQRAHACAYTTMQFYRSYGDNDVLVTLSALYKFFKENGGSYWLVRTMFGRGLTNDKERNSFYSMMKLVRAPAQLQAARAIMTIIEMRAVREGRLPPAK